MNTCLSHPFRIVDWFRPVSRQALCLLISSAAWSGHAAANADLTKGSPGCPSFWDATQYTSKPFRQMGRLGINVLPVWYPQNILDKEDPLKVDQAALEDVAKNTLRKYVAPQALALVVPSWPSNSTYFFQKDRPNDIEIEAEISASVDRYVELAKQSRGLTSAKTGFFDVVPVRNYWAPQKPRTSKEYRAWQDENSRLASVAEAVDILFPSLYAYREDTDQWARYARETISESRRIAPGKKVFAFIWPKFHPSAKRSNTEDPYVSPKFWRKKLEVLYPIADGIVIWGGWDDESKKPKRWSNSMPWWVETKDFLENTMLVCAKGK